MRFLLCAAGMLLIALGSGQTLFWSSEQAGPGSAISVVGNALSASSRFAVTPYASDGRPGAPVAVRPLQANGSVAILNLPASLPQGVYKVVATNGKAVSNPLYVNRARLQWLDVAEVRPGQSIRAVGRNFKPFPSLKPVVRLVNVGTGRAIAPPIAFAGDAVVKFTLPRATPPGRYRLMVNNGVAGAASATPDPLVFDVKPAAPDPFALGVAWGAECGALARKLYNLKTDPRLPARLRGDGRTDDAQALAVDLGYLGSHGGGVAYLPPGTYRVDDGKAWGIVYGNTVLRGAGKGRTVLQVGYPYTANNAAPDFHYALALAGGNKAPEGIADLTIENLNANAAPSGVLNGTGGVTTKAFLKNVEFRLGNSREVTFSGPEDAVIADCSFKSTAPRAGSLRLENIRGLHYLRNVDDHRAGRVSLTYGERIVIEGNTIRFDNAYRNAHSAETGGLETSFDQRLLLLGNELGALGPQPKDRAAGDGEVVLTQYAQTGDLLLTGTVRSAAGASLVSADPLPATPWLDGWHPSLARMAVFIVSGRGTGQWRRIQSWTTGSLSLDRPWQTAPDGTSRFAIAPLNNYQQTAVGNRLFGGFYGIEWEDGAVDSIAEGNALTDTGLLGVFAYTAEAGGGRWGAPGSNRSFTAAWGNAFLRNTLKNTRGARPATLSVCGFDLLNLNLGPLVLGTDVRGNAIVGNGGPLVSAQAGRNDGLEVISLDPGHPIVNNDVLVQGTVLQDNTVSESSAPLSIFNLTRGFLSNQPSRRPGK